MRYLSHEKRSYDAALRHAMEHVDLSSTIRAIEEGSYIPTVSLSELERVYFDFHNPRSFVSMEKTWVNHLWKDGLKIELNSITALLIEEIWESFREQREKTPQILHKENPIALREYTKSLFYTAAKVYLNKYDAHIQNETLDATPMDMAYARFKAIIQFGRAHGLMKNDTEKTFIAGGIGTAAFVTWGVIELVQKMANEKLMPGTQEAIASVIEKSYGTIIAPLASMHVDRAVPIIRNTSDVLGLSLNPAFFYLTADGNSWKLVFDHEKILNIDNRLGKPALTHKPDSPTTKCPAGYAQGERKSVIREYFEWSMRLAFNQ